jgi:hypothetical protein
MRTLSRLRHWVGLSRPPSRGCAPWVACGSLPGLPFTPPDRRSDSSSGLRPWGAPHCPSGTAFGGRCAGGQEPPGRRRPVGAVYVLKHVPGRSCPPPCRVGAPGFAPTPSFGRSRAEPSGLRPNSTRLPHHGSALDPPGWPPGPGYAPLRGFTAACPPSATGLRPRSP